MVKVLPRILSMVAAGLACGGLAVSAANATQRLPESFTGHTHTLSTRSVNGRVSATLQSSGRSPEGFWSYDIASQRTGASKSITISSVIQQAFELRVTEDGERATVLGWASSGGVYAFDVVDLVTGRLLVEVPCYRPAVSPSGRYVAFVQWAPPHMATVAQQSTVYRVAEIARLPQKPLNEVMDKYVGTEVYPKSPLRISRNSPTTDVSEGHQIMGIGFDWTDDSHFSFVDLYQHRETTVHVAIGPSGLNTLNVTTR